MASSETWKQIPYPLSKYEVSDLGRVRNIRSGRFLTPHLDKKTWVYRMYPVEGKKLYLKSDSQFRKEEYAEGRAGFMLEEYESAFDDWIFGSCVERRAW